LGSESRGSAKKVDPMTEKILVLSNCGSEEEARRVARALVEARVAACVNIVPGIQSVYHWQGAIQEDSEWMLVIKSTRSMFDSLSAELRKIHSYQVPEVLAIPIIAGDQNYLDWMDREIAGKC
jgi:periplasmic divalent cation tolerance protein